MKYYFCRRIPARNPSRAYRDQYRDIYEAFAARPVNLNKSTKIWLNYLAGGLLAIILLWAIYKQTHQQFARLRVSDLLDAEASCWLVIAVLLMPVNLGIEMCKWRLLAGSAQPLPFSKAAKSVLAGLALSLLTPNRIGEYPGRLLYLKRKNTIRLLSVTFLGIFTQFFTLFLFGIAGLVYYNIRFPGYGEKIVLLAALIIAVALSLVFFKFERITEWFEKNPRLKRFKTYSGLLRRFTFKEQLTVLLFSVLRFAVFTAQYLILLTWMKVAFPPGEGFLMASLFFWTMAVVPSLALAELGVRGQVSIYLFQHFSDNQAGILTATILLWFINVIIPSVIGCVLLFRMRLIK